MSSPPSDGTSQAARQRPELDPAFALIDERSIADDLAFARAYAGELVYVDPSGQLQGDWRALFPDADALLDAADYLRAPEKFSADRAAHFARPHFALLLAFLDLLGLARDQLNGLTRRHLDFYYREVLRMVRKRAVADSVHVLMALDSSSALVRAQAPGDAQARLQLRIPAGSALSAGKDSLGLERLYRTQTELMVSPVQVAQLKSVRADIRITGIRQANRAYLVRGSRQAAFLAMLRITLGSPAPGDALPTPVLPGLPPAQPAGQAPAEVGFETLVQAQQIVGFVDSGLAMPLFDDFRRLLHLRRRRADGDAGDWARINQILDQAGRQRDPAFVRKPQQADDFLANLRSALGLSVAQYAKLYDRLPEVTSADEAYAVLADRPDVQAFVQAELFLPLVDFKTMMQTKWLVDSEWAEICRWLEAAAQRRSTSTGFVFTPALRQARQFDALLGAALGSVSWPVAGGIDGLYDAFVGIEHYFCMSAERYFFIVAVARRSLGLPDNLPPDDADWLKVYAICADANIALVYRRRREALQRAAAPGLAAADPARALADMLALVLAEPVDAEPGLHRLPALGVGAADLLWLNRLLTTPGGADLASARVAEVLEIAQRNREHFVVTPPEQALWHHLYAAADARQVLAPGQPEGLLQPRWKPFGSLQAASQQAPPAAELLGWAISSPLLALAEGQRRVELTLGLDGDEIRFDPQALRRLLAPPDGSGNSASFNPFHLQLSGPEGWIDPDSVQLAWAGSGNQPAFGGYPAVAGVNTANLRALGFKLALSDQQPAVVPPTLALHGMAAPAPVLRLMLRPVWDGQAGIHHSAYQALMRLRLRRLQLVVRVAGLASLALSNEQAVLDPKKPFEPFGSNPSSGARLCIGHPELVAKALDSIGFRFSWMGAPAVLATHYANYPDGARPDSFSARIGLRDGLLFNAHPKPVALFDADTSRPVQRDMASPPDPGRPAVEIDKQADVDAWQRCWIWELAGDFQHAVYPALALQKSMALASEIAKGNKPEAAPFVVNPPYTPKLKGLVVDYSASAEQAALADGSAPGDKTPALALHHIHPFGHQLLRAGPDWTDASGVPLLPAYDAEGALYIGLSGMPGGSASQRLSLLFQVSEGSANPDVESARPQWSVLSGNRWLSLHDGPFQGSLLADGTRGLINAGIVELQLPPVLPSTLLPDAATAPPESGQPGGLYWLALRMQRATEAVCDLVALHPHAVLALFEDAGNAPDHLAQPLPCEQITGPLEPIKGLGRLWQPYSSFGGKPAERDERFNVRVSERLRHRQRALTAWDYERLVLEKFPQLYKVKCLRADALLAAADAPAMPAPLDDAASLHSLIEPGRIDLVVVPDITNRFPFNPFEPKASADLIRDIEAFLADKTPAFASLRVKNAHFVALKVRCGVRFMPGTDEGFCRQRLNDDINRFLSPWAYDDTADLVIGGSIYANSIINFIEQRDYVDFIAGLRLFTIEDGLVKLVPEAAGYHARPQRPDAVLVAATEHEFDVIAASDFRVQGFGGIGNMRIELDFIVA